MIAKIIIAAAIRNLTVDRLISSFIPLLKMNDEVIDPQTTFEVRRIGA